VKRELCAVSSEEASIDDDEQLGALERLERLTVRTEALPLYKRLMRLAITAERERNWPATRGFLSEARQVLELSGRAHGEFANEPENSVRKPFVIILGKGEVPARETPELGYTIDIAAES